MSKMRHTAKWVTPRVMKENVILEMNSQGISRDVVIYATPNFISFTINDQANKSLTVREFDVIVNAARHQAAQWNTRDQEFRLSNFDYYDGEIRITFKLFEKEREISKIA